MYASDTNRFRVAGSITQQDAFALLRILFGCIWLFNTWFQATALTLTICSFSHSMRG
jgi:hypothetical protein